MTATQTPKFNPELYAPIKSNHLVIYAIYDLQKQVETISPEDVISICFTLFPQRFCLKKYPQWPDSAMIARRLHDLPNQEMDCRQNRPRSQVDFQGNSACGENCKSAGFESACVETKGRRCRNVEASEENCRACCEILHPSGRSRQ